MNRMSRRNMLRIGAGFAVLPGAILKLGLSSNLNEGVDRAEEFSADSFGTGDSHEPTQEQESTKESTKTKPKDESMKVHYLEIVTPEVDAVCENYSQLLGLTFGEKDPAFGNARKAEMPNGGTMGVRAPLRETEKPVVRNYFLVEDIQASVDAAAKLGAEIALPPMDMPGHGKFSIFIQGGIETGLWQAKS